MIAAVMVAACADSWLATELFLNWGGTTVPCIYCQLYIVWPHSYKEDYNLTYLEIHSPKVLV